MVYFYNAYIAKLVIKKFADKRFFKFLIVGAFGTAVDFILFYICYTFLDLGIIVGNTISYGIGLTGSFFINRIWTFSDGKERSHKRLFFALSFGYLGLVINTALVWAFAFVVPVFVGKSLAVVIIVFYNYLTNKHLVFLVK
jgi:putative flippase GtrA